MSHRDTKPANISPEHRRRVLHAARREERRLARILRPALAQVARALRELFDGAEGGGRR